MYLQLILCTACLVNGFIPNISPVKLIVSSEALTGSLTTNFHRIIPENFIIDSMFRTRFHPELDVFYLCLIFISLYSRYKEFDSKSHSRWSSIPMYSFIQKKTNTVLLIVMLVFTKNIENAI